MVAFFLYAPVLRHASVFLRSFDRVTHPLKPAGVNIITLSPS